ncbi:MAG: aminotransferase class V-fold PLP-dependent enzyme [Bacillota bacterium]|nr:aminotransferase class V-fold PLP-dependent enzyme [Bacillota bacterium]
MIYLDNSATTFPKPACMWKAMEKCLREYCGNPGRSGHEMALKTGEGVYEARKTLAALLGAEEPGQILFTLNATEALNLGILGVLGPGDRVVTTAMEHNSVLRPLKMAEGWGVETDILKCGPDGTLPLDNLKKALQKKKTRLVVCTHASNVTGTIMPVAEAGALAREAGALFLVDGAQSAGSLEIHVRDMNMDLLALSGHKGLLGPQGTGLLYVRRGIPLRPLKYGGTGTNSRSRLQAGEFPEDYEAGTVNSPGVIGLGASVRWLLQTGVSRIRAHEMRLMARLDAGLRAIPGVSVYGPEDPARRAGALSFNIAGLDCEKAADILARQYGVALRAGFHCAGLAHKTIGTWETGALRAGIGPFTTEEDLRTLLDAVEELTRPIWAKKPG